MAVTAKPDRQEQTTEVTSMLVSAMALDYQAGSREAELLEG